MAIFVQGENIPEKPAAFPKDCRLAVLVRLPTQVERAQHPLASSALKVLELIAIKHDDLIYQVDSAQISEAFVSC